MHYYQHHIGDFIKATARLSDSQSMGYLRLLWMYYDSEKPLKPDSKVLAFQIGSTVEDTELLLESFFILCENGWHHTRCDKEIAEYRAFLDKKSNAGKASAERRKNNSSTGVKQVLNSGVTSEQLTTNHKPLTTNQVILQDKPAKRPRKTSISSDFSISIRVKDWAAKNNFDKLDEHLDAFVRKATMNAYQYVDWDLAFMEAIREDWAKLRGKPSFYQNSADIARVTVPMSDKPDPALEKIKADAKKAAPPSMETLAKMAELRKKA